MDMHRLKQVQVAELLGVTARQIHNLVKQGMPTKPETGKVFYDGPACVAWYIQRKVSEGVEKAAPTSEFEAKARLDGLRSDLLEVQLQKARGDVLPVEYAVTQLEQIGERLRGKLQAFPSRWAPELMGARTIPEMASRLEAAINDAMGALVTVAEDMDQADLEEAA